MSLLPYLLPAFPLFVRLLVAVRFSGYMHEVLPDEALERSEHRTVIVALAGFSFAGLLGLVALSGNLSARQLSIWYVLVSFLFLLAVLNIQGYKGRRWQEWLGDGLLEGASFGLIASVISFILLSDLPFEYQMAALALASAVWVSDFLIRLWFAAEHLRAKEKSDGLSQDS